MKAVVDYQRLCLAANPQYRFWLWVRCDGLVIGPFGLN